MGARLTVTVLADGVVYDAGTAFTDELGGKIPAHLWDGPVPESKPATASRKAKSE